MLEEMAAVRAAGSLAGRRAGAAGGMPVFSEIRVDPAAAPNDGTGCIIWGTSTWPATFGPDASSGIIWGQSRWGMATWLTLPLNAYPKIVWGMTAWPALWP